MRSFRGSDIISILQLLAIFFAGATFAYHSSTSAADLTPLLAHANSLLVQRSSCPCHHLHATKNSTTTIGFRAHPAHPDDVIQEPDFARGTRTDPKPISSLPLQEPSKPADYSETVLFTPQGTTARSTSVRSRIRAAGAAMLEGIPEADSLRALLPAWARAEPGRRRDLNAMAASVLKMGSSSLHVAAATLGLLILGTIMCTL
ncbi:uncharacterized protein DNG_03732 [Cephalotrichum gorgonifer]|uniref:Uncharacterized protein n=1 Tax=Cephalotrichum gorgonifer TaxID=2041049 RepID=A0AAE8MXH8_9PEZI|nr:uncharacterized protein DNG_03732 [Cephalotrichum gorgonifer]